MLNETLRNRRARTSGPRKLTPAELAALFLQQDAYFASGGFADGSYLRQHSRETPSEYSARQELRHYQNFFGGVVDASLSPVFMADANRSGGSPLYEAFVEDVTGGGETLDAFVARATLGGDLYGGVAIVMDAPSFLGASLAEQLAQRRLPYLYAVAPQEWEEYALDPTGALSYFKFYTGQNSEGVETFRSFSRLPGGKAATWRTTGDAAEPPVAIPVFPYFLMLGNRPAPYSLPISRWATLADTAKMHFNINSLVTVQEFMAAFNILTFQGTKSDLTLSENSVIFYPPGSNSPDFISPDPATIEVLLGHLERLKEYVYQVSYQGLVLSTANASGESKKWSDRMRQERLAWVARRVEALETWIAQSFAIWTSTTQVAVVRYPSSFETLSLDEDLAAALKLLELGLAPENAVRVKTQALLSAFSEADQEEKDAIVAAEQVAGQDYPLQDGDGGSAGATPSSAAGV